MKKTLLAALASMMSLQAAPALAESYEVNLTRKGSNVYEVFGTSSYIKTSSCLSLALGEEAYLTISPSGFGRLRFDDGGDCMVEAVYTKLRL